VFNYAAGIVGLGLEPTLVVLQSAGLAAGEAASIVDDDGVVRRQIPGYQPEGVG
jgi:hypothetical protein